VSDYVNGTGHVFGYATTIMENGDKVYSRYEAMNQTGGNGRGNTLYVTTITGGTGQFKTLRGLLRGTGALAFSEGRVTSNDVQDGRTFGDTGEFVPSGSASFVHTSAQDSLALSPELQYFVLPNFAVGIGLLYTHASIINQPSFDTYGGSASIGYNLRLASNVS